MLNKTLITLCAIIAIVRIWQLEAENSALRAKAAPKNEIESVEEWSI